jgi:hypothetical protein
MLRNGETYTEDILPDKRVNFDVICDLKVKIPAIIFSIYK